MACGDKKASPCKGDGEQEPCDEGAIYVHISTCIGGVLVESKVPLNEIIPPPALAKKTDQGK